MDRGKEMGFQEFFPFLRGPERPLYFLELNFSGYWSIIN